MKESEMRKELYKKMTVEYDALIEKLKSSSADTILSYAYEKVMKEETLGLFNPKYENFGENQIEVLYKMDTPLEFLYKEWMKSEIRLDELCEESAYSAIDKEIHRKISNHNNAKESR